MVLTLSSHFVVLRVVEDHMRTYQKCKSSSLSQINGMRNSGHETQTSVFRSHWRRYWSMLSDSFWFTPLLNPEKNTWWLRKKIDQLDNILLLGCLIIFCISLRVCYVLWCVNKYISSPRLWPSLGQALGNCYFVLFWTHIINQQTYSTSKYLHRMYYLPWSFLSVSKSFYLSRKRQRTLRKVQ